MHVRTSQVNLHHADYTVGVSYIVCLSCVLPTFSSLLTGCYHWEATASNYLLTRQASWLAQPTAVLIDYAHGTRTENPYHIAVSKRRCWSHGDMVFKGDTSSQWEKANLPLSPQPHPLTDSHEILHTILFTISPHKPHLVKIAPRVTSPHSQS